MRRIILISSGLLTALALAVPLAFAQPVAIGKKGDVELTAETRVGSTTLTPGHYRFQHELIEGQHYLVVRAQSTVQSTIVGSTHHYAGPAKDEVARVACRVVSTDKKQRETALSTITEADGTRRVTQIAIRGEQGSHVVLEPQS
jgi:hypothetical protein